MKHLVSRIKIFLGILLVLGFTFNANSAERRSYPQQGLMFFTGLDDTSSPPAVKDSRAADLLNISLDETGKAVKRYGYDLEVDLDTNDVSDAYEPITSIYELYTSTGAVVTRTKIATCANKLFSWSTGAKTNITSGATITEGAAYQWQWITALNYAIGTNGTDAPLKTNGTTTSALSFGSTGVTDAKCLVWWKNYLIFGNTVESATAYPTRIRWSNVGTIETWSSDDYVDIATLGGQQIEGFGMLYDNLYIFLTDSIYKVSLVGGDELITVTRVSEGIGCIARGSIQNVQIGNSEALIFLSRDRTINVCDGVKVNEISTLISGVMSGLGAARLPYATSVNDRTSQHYYLSVTDGTASYNNLILDYNYLIGEWSKWDGIESNAFALANDTNEVPQIYFGNYDSMIYQLQDSNLHSDVAGESGVVDAIGKLDNATASGLTVIYDSSATFTDVTGATVRITSGTGIDEEGVIVSITSTATGILVANDFTATLDTTSNYTIGAIDAYYTTKWYDLGNATMRKNFMELFLWHTTDTSSTMQVYNATDFSSDITSIDVTLGASGSLWGTAIWGTSTWAGTATSLSIAPINNSGRFIKFKFSEGTIDEPMELYGYSLILRDLDEL